MLVERARQIAVLHEAFDACTKSGGRAVIVGGPGTCGKTSLLREFVHRLTDAGTLVFSATGSAIERPTALGIMGQLFHSVGLKGDFDRRVAGEAPPGTPESAETPGTFGQGVDPRVVEDACSLLLDRVGDGPALICVDDIHHADEASLDVLLYLQRRLRHRAVLIALSTADSAWVPTSPFFAELSRNLPCDSLSLGMLSVEGVAELLRERAGTAQVAAYHDASGGNPMLLNAMVRDAATGWEPGDADVAPVSGSASFRSAVAICLYRGEPATLETARCLSILEMSDSRHLLPDALGVSADTADRALDALMAVGLLREDHSFRHPLAGAAVRETMSAKDRGAYHWRVAALLQREGADASAVATHLVAADARPMPWWGASVMADAAEEALRDDRPDLAVRYAESALRTTATSEDHATVLSILFRAKRWTSPSAAASHLPALQEALREGHLTSDGVESLISGLLWQARSDDVLHTLRQLESAEGEPDPQRAAMVDAMRAWLRYVSPPAVGTGREVTRALTGCDGGPDSGRTLSRRAQSTLLAALGGDDAEQVGIRADDVLQNCESGDPAVEPLLSALLALIYADRLEQAGRWCDRLLALFDARGMVMLKAVLSSVAAEVALRRGDMPLASTHASEALSLMSKRSWGVVIGYPLGTLVMASTTLRKFDEAAALLNRPVPRQMFDTTFGLSYLHARGRHALVTGRPYAALEDFRRCGQLMGDWDFDLPTIVPWRNSVGEAHLALGRVDEAHAMFDEQLTLARGKSTAVQAASLRLLAKTGKPLDRLPRLQESAKLLSRSSHLLDLTVTLAELSNEHYAQGDSARSRTVGRRAMQIAQMCDAQGVARGLLLSEDRFDLVGLLPLDETPNEELSHAEARVAGLAAEGLTNREIGRKLYLSVSTVEQHLTRVFRKLGISRRTELIGLLRQETTERNGPALDRAAAQG
ncbi:LuxR family transcriptional regulator [Streptomyces sp. 5-10]|uniref:helix-turn-helix transcriptional regulator n=1 Tax=Streptomyces sp. 5-10 TaxID=878925 RepID=UPI00168B91BE|nr:LuxR family transcriptional regulator [Streptomyces sp. 5-10]MBD3004916.1 AAA family ATPase [Streptomyces sp. 5-10]